MDEKYFAKKIEGKWQKKWAESRVFEAEIDEEKPKFYQLEMLPYPSGNLHMGHVRNYSVGDALAWYKRLKGFNVIHPIGWDSFGQPAEDAAVKRGVNPRTWTEDNINVMRGQLQRLGISYDWSRQIYAHSPEYYKFDQWFFIKMFERGLAYKKMTQVNWCEHDQATLSNEQASGGICWRCGNPVTKKDLEQWFLKTTSYADQLINDIAEIEAGWPQNVIKRQRDWIGKSEGAFVEFRVVPSGTKLSEHHTAEPVTPDAEHIRVFTTRIDTIYGANAIVVAAGHPILAVENIESHYRVDPTLFSPRAHYLLRVRGDSMQDAGILDGDLLAVHRTREARNGQIVVARVGAASGDEVTVKRLRKRGRDVVLVPENAAYEPIVVDPHRTPFTIEGVAVGLVRSGSW